MLKLHKETVNEEPCIKLHDRLYSFEEDVRGIREKFWLVRSGGRFSRYHNEPVKSTHILFKFNRNNVSCEDWGEIYASAIARMMGVPCVEYYSAQLYDEDNSFLGNGVVCGSYKKHLKEVEYTGFDLQNLHLSLIYDECEGKRIDKLNTVDGFIESIKDVFSGRVNEEDLQKIRNDLIKQAIFDYLLAQTDRHWLNTTFLATDMGGVLTLRKADCYDNGCIALLKRKMSAIEGMSKEIGKLGKDSPYLKSQLDNYCPMFGMSTSTVVIEDRTGNKGLDRLKVVDPKKSKEIFLDEIAEEILINPEIAVFFKKLESMREQGIVSSVTKDLYAADDNPPLYVAKMIKDVVGCQFDTLQNRVHTKLQKYKASEREGM